MFGFFRTALALVVVVQHFSATPQIGILAVFGFFTLSGFLMTLLVTGPYKGRIGAFAVNRFLRLYPMYWAVLLVSVIALALGSQAMASAMGLPSGWHWLRAILFLNFSAMPPLAIPTSWAVTNEIFWYVIIACGISATLGRSLVWLAFGIAYTVIVWKFWPTPTLFYFLFTAGSLPFAAGAALYHVQHLFPERFKWHAVVIGGAVLAACVVLVGMEKVDTWRTIYFAFIPATALTVVGLYKVKPSSSWAKLDDRIGSVSYPIYLDHYLAASLLTYFYPVRANEGSYQVLFVMALSLAIAVLLVKFVDQPIERIRRRIKEGKTASRFAAHAQASRAT